MTIAQWREKTPAEVDRLKAQFKALVTEQQMTQRQAAAMVGITPKTACNWVKALGVTVANGGGGNGYYSKTEVRDLKMQVMACIAGFKLSQRLTAVLLSLSMKTLRRWVRKFGGVDVICKMYEADPEQYMRSAKIIYNQLRKNDKYKRYHTPAETVLKRFLTAA